MHLLEIIADAMENPEGAYDRMLEMGVQHDVIDNILALSRDEIGVSVLQDGPCTHIIYASEWFVK